MRKKEFLKNKKRPILGRGLGALLDKIETEEEEKVVLKTEQNISQVDLHSIEVNPYQPRTDFEKEALEELALSIKQHGLIQPITLREIGDKYQIISGERRYRASLMNGEEKITAYIRSADNEEMLSFSLIENVQREGLNPIEVAISYQRLVSECHLTQEQVALKLSKKRATITNYLRLLKLPEIIQKAIKERKITKGHAKALCSIEDIEKQLIVFEKILQKQISVRQVELLSKELKKLQIVEKKNRKKTYPEVQSQLSSHFSTKVQLSIAPNEKGNIHIPFYSIEDLQRILKIINFEK